MKRILIVIAVLVLATPLYAKNLDKKIEKELANRVINCEANQIIIGQQLDNFLKNLSSELAALKNDKVNEILKKYKK